MLFVLDTLRTQTIGHVFINTHWEWVGFLEHHTNADTQIRHIDIAIHILAIHGQLTGNCDSLNEIIHTIQAAQQG
ncbi:Uncharacterised protein [Vibrio cholerae]|uniref:Uncharacterized protein n=1 Tax=Vibrio cholerae TaxID=666 RepID=A0A655URP1_VIBCL|nr:Uncharacterised protein [Vibrio cholerae]CSA58392.1 Uncharacterised protein [Vibrio cholerae]CSB55540.1 Uncharacterised protein [Vibrio cholerae]CSC05990.1 Uncharacterised protein [Vibrio cholerae]CSC34733.1 Uncharacterised protein [Vibrio cholerae]